MGNREDIISMEELQEKHREIAEVIGIEKMIRLSEMFGGSRIYIPQKKELIKNNTYRLIMEEYDGGNIKQLSAKYQISEATIYKLVKKNMKCHIGPYMEQKAERGPEKKKRKAQTGGIIRKKSADIMDRSHEVPGQMSFSDLNIL